MSPEEVVRTVALVASLIVGVVGLLGAGYYVRLS